MKKGTFQRKQGQHHVPEHNTVQGPTFGIQDPLWIFKVLLIYRFKYKIERTKTEQILAKLKHLILLLLFDFDVDHSFISSIF